MNIGIVPCYQDPRHVMQRWRYDILIKYLPQYGHTAEYYREGEQYSLAIVPIITENLGVFRRISARGIPIIGDITDDLLTFPYSNYNLAGQLYYRVKFNLDGEFRRFREMLEKSRQIVAGSEYQKKKFLAYNPKVSRVTDAVTDDILSLQARYENTGPCRIAWFGNVLSLHGFRALGKALDELSSRGEYELVLITRDYVQGRYLGARPRTVHEFIRGQKIPCRWVPWGYEALLKETAACDIGIVPVNISEPFIAAKPPGRALLMMGMGLPVVAGPVESHLETMQEGVTGFIARTPGEWADAIGRLRASAGLRRSVGTNAARYVRENFSEKIFARRYLEIINGL